MALPQMRLRALMIPTLTEGIGRVGPVRVRPTASSVCPIRNSLLGAGTGTVSFPLTLMSFKSVSMRV